MDWQSPQAMFELYTSSGSKHSALLSDANYVMMMQPIQNRVQDVLTTTFRRNGETMKGLGLHKDDDGAESRNTSNIMVV